MPFVASGSYGCIYNPPLKCSSTSRDIDIPKKTRVVSKIFSNNNEFEIEKNIQEIISKIDPDHKFTLPYYGNCNVTNLKKTAEISSCEHIDLKKQKSYKQLLYQYGGKDFADLLSNRPGSILLFKKILKSFQPVVNGLQSISKNKYIHLDIKPDNILYYRGKVLLIDFGIMTKKKHIFDFTNVLDHDYPFYPPEFKMYIHRNTSYSKFLQRFGSNFEYRYSINSKRVSTYDTITDLIKYDTDDQKADLIALYNSKDIRSYTDKIDVYSLGIVLALLYVWSNYDKHEKLASKNNNFKLKVCEIIRGMIRFDPEKRYSVSKLINEYNELIGLL
jgi:serine/threonine protein kinase